MTEKNYKLIKYVSLVIYPAIVLAVIVRIISVIDDTDKVFALYISVLALCIWMLFFILSVRKVLAPPVLSDQHTSYLIVLGIFHVVPLYSTIVVMKDLITGEAGVGWELVVLILLNALLVLNFFQARKTTQS
jgi:hypothetical protein